MPVKTINLKIPYVSEGFPAGTTLNTSSELSVSWNEILWAALTIGRPSNHNFTKNGDPSYYEALFRMSLVYMALEQHGPRATRIRRTSAFKELDPTEKGAVNYFIGMIFAKLFASRLLSTPWLLHLDIYRSHYSASNLGRSRPDLFGQSSSGTWHSFETKGRASKPSAADKAKAKAQATRLISVAGTPCSLHVGSFSYFIGDALNFYWVDPPPERKRPIEIPSTDGAWKHYFGPIRSLWDGRSGGDSTQVGGFSLNITEFDVTIEVHPLLVGFFLFDLWDDAQSALLDSHEELVGDGFQPDGIKVVCGPSWSQRRPNAKTLE